ncbi:nucleoside hydrolase [Streptomyces sp. NBC_00669]|uniref:nucleoside hydrolase n=1 Tax=Streptomyces sp. NBC_00669 TaxID=2976011 RepID=UPI002E3042F8|nr:nucleoside hydrolase [Streptomyces sp. NBC_00669]
MTPMPIVLDSDPGLDDTVALHYLLTRPEWDLRAYTAVGGNLPVDGTFRNARAIAAAFGIDADVPVHRGAGRPISRVTVRSDFHGPEGLGRQTLPDSRVRPPAEDAVSALLRLSRRFEGELTVVATGPLTNVAAALVLDPGFARRVRALVFMGGAARVPGNITPVAEFNIWADPDAADIVVSSGIEFTMVGLDATQLAVFDRSDLAVMEEHGGAGTELSARVLRDYLAAYARFTGQEHCFLHDPLAVAVATDPRFAALEHGAVVVGCDLGLGRGRTVFVPEVETNNPNLPPGISERLDMCGRVAIGAGTRDFVPDFLARLTGGAHPS